MRAVLLSIGDELILGHTVDTNAAWLSSQLAQRGVRVLKHLTVPDDLKQIELAIRQACDDMDLVVCTGGLGPTADDLTRAALAAALGTPLIEHPSAVAHLEAWYAGRGRLMPPQNRVQALIPEGAEPIDNPIGTAPGVAATRGQTRFYAMPGVPGEMRRMYRDHVEPTLATDGPVILSRRLHTFGVSESVAAERLEGLIPAESPCQLGTTVNGGVVSICLSGRWTSAEQGEQEIESIAELVRQRLDDELFGSADQTLASAVGSLLEASGQSVATAESCTGGLVGKLLTDIAGSSAWYRGGWIVYTNDLKQSLGVSADLLQTHGAVSEPVVCELARRARAAASADHALAISGIAGPGGGTESKPIGTVCIAHAAHDDVVAITHQFSGDRPDIRFKSAQTALNLLRRHLLDRRQR
jgi:nicotinamide-nucleotide amidase